MDCYRRECREPFSESRYLTGRFQQGARQGLGLAGLVFRAGGNMGRVRLPDGGPGLRTLGDSSSEGPVPGKTWVAPPSGHLPEPWSPHQRWHPPHVACMYFGFLCAQCSPLFQGQGTCPVHPGVFPRYLQHAVSQASVNVVNYYTILPQTPIISCGIRRFPVSIHVINSKIHSLEEIFVLVNLKFFLREIV